MRVTPPGVTLVVVGEPTPVGEPILSPSRNPALRGVNLEVVGEPTLGALINKTNKASNKHKDNVGPNTM